MDTRLARNRVAKLMAGVAAEVTYGPDSQAKREALDGSRIAARRCANADRLGSS